MQRLPENFSVLNDRLERPAPNNSVEGDEIVRSIRKRMGQVNPLVPGSSPGGPTILTCIFSFADLVAVYLQYNNRTVPAQGLAAVGVCRNEAMLRCRRLTLVGRPPHRSHDPGFGVLAPKGDINIL